uniref:CSON009495 protein n=1 Tax=Culicoides sonorensis TaxID=179676 RepID=A0A336M0G5_CULSO
MNKFKFFLVISFTICYFIEGGLCCDGFKIKVISIKNCGGASQVIKISENATLKLNKDCEVVPNNACVDSEAFKTAQVTFSISKNNIPVLNGNRDLCKTIEKANDEIKSILDMFGVPKKCPYAKTALCTTPDNKVNIMKHKAFLGMAMGRVSIHADIEHDTVRFFLNLR